MANWSTLKAAIASVIKNNGNQEITGQLLQNVLNNIVSSVGENSTFAGIATPTTNPGVPDGNVFYLATETGTYSNFNAIKIESGEAVILEWRGSWVKKSTGLATQNSNIINMVISFSNIKCYSDTSKIEIASLDTSGYSINGKKITLNPGTHKTFRVGVKEKNTNNKSIFGYLILKSNMDISNIGYFYTVNTFGKVKKDEYYYYYIPYDKSYNSHELGYQSNNSFSIESQLEVEVVESMLSSYNNIMNVLDNSFKQYPFNMVVLNENYKIDNRIDNANGNEIKESGYFCSDYINVEKGRSYKSVNGFGFWAIYNSEKLFKRGGKSTDSSTILTIKDDEYYIRVSSSIEDVLKNGFGFTENSSYGSNLQVYNIVNGLQNRLNFNLFNPREIIYNKYLENGIEKESAGWYCSDYIKVDNYKELYGLFGFYAFYNSEKSVIQSGLISLYSRINVPANAVYLRISYTATASYGSVNPWDIIISPYPFISPINDDFTVKSKLWYRVLESISSELNLFNFDRITKDRYVNKDNGLLIGSINWVTTDYIEILPNNLYTFSGYYAWYNENKEYISGGLNYSVETIQSPSDAKYLRDSLPAHGREQHLELSITRGNKPNPIKKLISILSKDENPDYNVTKIIVDINGQVGEDCNFNDIESAMESITDSSETKQYEIIVKNGTYNIISNYVNLKDYVTVTGESKTGVIIYKEDLTNNESCACFDPGTNNIQFSKINNLTMICKGGKCCVHSDRPNAISKGGKLLIDNCIMKYISVGTIGEHHKGGVNVGLHSGQTVEITNCQGDVKCYMHSSINPTVAQSPSYFIVKGCNLSFIGAYDIANKNNNYFIAENNKVDYIGIGVSPLSENPKHMSLIYNINNNDAEWVYFMKNGNNEWFDKYPVCINSIHRYCENFTENLIPKHTFVVRNYMSKVLADQPFNTPNVKPFEEGSKEIGITMEDIPSGESGVVQFAGKLLLDNTDFNVGDYLTLNSSGKLDVGAKDNAVGYICSKDVDSNKCWFKFLE